MSWLHDAWQKIVQTIHPSTYNRLRLVFYTTVIILFMIGSALYFQKMQKFPYSRYKSPYISTENQAAVGVETEFYDHFDNPFGLPIFDCLLGFLIGLLLYHCSDKKKIQRNQSVSWVDLMKISIISVIVLVLTPITTMMTSFITMSLITSCQLIIIVILAIFFSESSANFRVQKRQIIIAIVLCVGVLIYNLFDYKKDGQDKPLNWLSGLVLFILLLVASLKPQLMAHIRDRYSPSPSYIYLEANKYGFIILIVISAATTHLWSLCTFIWRHDNLMLDLFIQSLLHNIAGVISYRVSLQYKQHILPIIITVRKLLSSLLSAYVFSHSLNKYQYLGLGLVFSALLVNIYLGIKEKDENDKSSVDHDPQKTSQCREPTYK